MKPGRVNVDDAYMGDFPVPSGPLTAEWVALMLSQQPHDLTFKEDGSQMVKTSTRMPPNASFFFFFLSAEVEIILREL